MYKHIWKYMQQCIFLYWYSQKWQPKCNPADWVSDEIFVWIAQKNQNCVYLNLSFNVFKPFLLQYFSTWNTRAVLGLMPLLFPSYVMRSKFIQNAVLMFFFPRLLLYIWALKGFKLLPATVIVEGKLSRFLLSLTWWIQSCLWTPDNLVSASTESVSLHHPWSTPKPLQKQSPFSDRVTSFCRWS